jgi:hypothetical protein
MNGKDLLSNEENDAFLKIWHNWFSTNENLFKLIKYNHIVTDSEFDKASNGLWKQYIN